MFKTTAKATYIAKARLSKVSRDSLLSSAYLLTAHDVVAIYTKKVAPEIKAHIFCLAPMAIEEEEEEEEEEVFLRSQRRIGIRKEKTLKV